MPRVVRNSKIFLYIKMFLLLVIIIIFIIIIITLTDLTSYQTVKEALLTGEFSTPSLLSY